MTEPFCKTEPKSQHERDFIDIVKAGDTGKLRSLLKGSADLITFIDAPLFAFDSPAIVHAKHRLEVVDTLLDFGADINRRSDWWAGSFGVLDGVDSAQAAELMSRGAVLDIHSAAGLGKLEAVRDLLDGNPALIHARGGDGQTPLHFAGSIEVIDLLVERGADLEVRDLDHSATAVQYAVDAPDRSRRLLSHGATPDIYLACALGLRDLSISLVTADADVLTHRIGSCPRTKPIHERSDQHIYAWKLNGAKSAWEVAKNFGHDELYRELLELSPTIEQFLAVCWFGDDESLQHILTDTPNIVSELSQPQQQELARAAWQGNEPTVRRMLQAGFDPHVRGDEESTPLDRAAFHGHCAIVKRLLEHDPDPPLTWKNRYGGTPLDACCYGSVHGWKRGTDYVGTAKALIHAGARFEADWLPTGNERIDELLRRHLMD